MDLKHCFCNLKDDLFNCFLLAKFSAMISLKVVDIICQIGIGIGFCHSDSLSSSCKSQWSVITNQWPNPSEWVSCVLTVQSFHTTLGDWLANPTAHLFMKLLKLGTTSSEFGKMHDTKVHKIQNNKKVINKNKNTYKMQKQITDCWVAKRGCRSDLRKLQNKKHREYKYAENLRNKKCQKIQNIWNTQKIQTAKGNYWSWVAQRGWRSEFRKLQTAKKV